jgi:cytochrome c oxidase assembly protein subunit 15
VLPEADFARGFDLTRPLGMNDDGTLLPLQALVAIHWVHRAFALVVTIAIAWLAARLWRASALAPHLGRTAIALLVLLTLQLLTGVSNVVFTWPLGVAVMHNGGAAAIAALLALLNSRLVGPGPATATAAHLARAS